jgi:hypothetical protein
VPVPTPKPIPVPAPKPVPPPDVKPPKEDTKKDLKLPDVKPPDENNPDKPIVSQSGVLTWRQGELHGEDVFKTKRQPYDKTPIETTVGNPPPGATIISGPGSAKQTIKILSGEAPKKDVKVKIGAFDAVISPAGPKKVTIRFAAPEEARQNTQRSSRRSAPGKEHPTELGAGVVVDSRGRHVSLY